MSISFFIADKLSGNKSNSFNKTISIIAIASVAIGLMVMIIAIAVVTGFKQEIINKIVGFGSHIQIVKYDNNNSLEMEPLSVEQPYYPALALEPGVRHIQTFAIKAGLLKKEEEIQGVALKGIGQDYDWSFFSDKIVEGRQIIFHDSSISNDIMISKTLSSMLNTKLNDEVRVFFLSPGQFQLRGRKFNVCAIFETGMEELDNMFVLVDINQIRQLNGWNSNQVSGFEVLLYDFDDMEAITQNINISLPYDQTAIPIKQLHPQIFDWLNLQDTNSVIIIVMMLFVAAVTIISTLLIIIFDNTSTIGILKAMGSNNRMIRRIFTLLATKIVLTGVVVGNTLGIGLCLLQQYFSIIKLPQESYYMNHAPIMLNLWHILFLNIGIFAITIIMVWLTSWTIVKIPPIKTIKCQ